MVLTFLFAIYPQAKSVIFFGVIDFNNTITFLWQKWILTIWKMVKNILYYIVLSFNISFNYYCIFLPLPNLSYFILLSFIVLYMYMHMFFFINDIKPLKCLLKVFYIAVSYFFLLFSAKVFFAFLLRILSFEITC